MLKRAGAIELYDNGSSSPGAFFGSGPGGWHEDRDKHWVQLLENIKQVVANSLSLNEMIA